MGQFIRNRFEIPFLGRVTEEGTFHAMPSAQKKTAIPSRWRLAEF